jgi:hypothetical protein
MSQTESPEWVRLPTTGVSPEVVAALDHLSITTGLSKAFLIRSMLMTALADLGLLGEPDLQPTQPRGPRGRTS